MVYLDHSATTAVDPEVMETFIKATENFWGNPSSLHHFGALAEQVVFKSSRQILTLLDADDHQVIYTGGATESNNLALMGIFGQEFKGHLITTAIEHPSVYEVAHELEKKGVKVSYLNVNQSVQDILKELENLIQKDTMLVSLMHVNSEMGLVLPIKEIGELLCLHPRIKFHVDGVQSVGKLPVSLKAAHIDMLSLSAHKIHGIKGVGGLVVRRNILLTPEIIGGGQMNGMRSGTVNGPGIASFAKAMRLIVSHQKSAYEKISQLYKETLQALNEIPEVTINQTPWEHSPYIINFVVSGVKGETMVHALSEHDVYISAKSACASKTKKASYVMLAIGASEEVATESLRISFCWQTTADEIQTFITALKEQIKQLT